MKGIHNMGNTCYINTVIQCLSYCNSFLTFVLDAKYQEHLKNKDDNIIDILASLYKDLWVNEQTVIPRDFLKGLYSKMNGMINIFEQNDINEFIAIFIDKLNDEICKPFQPKLGPYNSSSYDNQRKKMDYSWYLSNKKDYSPLKDMFYGQMISQIVCGNCGKIHHNYEVFMNIMVPVLPETTLIDCIANLLNEDSVNNHEDDNDNTWKCDSCNECAKSKKTIKLWRLPDILIISLKRFSSDLKKINNHIIIPDVLDMKPFAISPHKLEYQLKSVALHAGAFHSGHYIAACKNKEKWFLIDDESVNQIKPECVGDLIKNGYMFFYERI